MTRSLRPLLATTLIFLFAYALAVSQQPAMLSTRVLGNFLTDNAFLGIAAVGMTFVILSGGIDLSVGAVIGFTTVLVAVLIMWLNLHPLLAFAIALIVATAFGAVMGAAIHYLKVPSFIVTLAGMFLARGGASVLSPDSIGIEHPSSPPSRKATSFCPAAAA
jgi:galactofuranose transport system permease protein